MSLSKHSRYQVRSPAYPPEARGASSSGGDSTCSSGAGQKKLFLLDRDGVINADVGPPGVLSCCQLRLLPGSAEAIRRLNEAGYKVVVVTNQTSVRKGFLSRAGLDKIHAHMRGLLAKAGAHIDSVLVATEAPHLKPSPSLLLEALELSGCEAQDAVMVGDKWSDLEAAAAANVPGILVQSSQHADAALQQLQAGEFPAGSVCAVQCFPDLAAAVASELSSDLGGSSRLKSCERYGRVRRDKASWISAALVGLLGGILVALVVALHSADQLPLLGTQKRVDSPVGWLGALGAVLLFGSSNLLLRLRTLDAVDTSARPGLFAAFSGLGIGLGNLVICSALRLLHLLQGRPAGILWGLAGAADISAIQLLAFVACQLLGIAAAPSVWCGIGMGTSFMWGFLVFQEPVRSVAGVVAALASLAAGVAMCAVAQTELPRKLMEQRHRETTQDSKVPVNRLATLDRRIRLLRGLALALCVGVLDGSLMAPFKFFAQRASVERRISQISYAYLEVFGLGLFMLLPLLLVGQALLWRRRRANFLGFFAAAKTCALPGIVTGFFWAMANACSIHASEYLGIAVGFPLTQTAIVVNALWGIVLFKEMPSLAQRTTCAMGISVILAGAALLATFGNA